MEQIAVILVNYNGIKFNDKCIESVLGSSVKGRIQIVVVDNHSTDGSREALNENWKDNSQVHLIDLEDNVGFARANNVGIRWAISRGINRYLLLNNDTEMEQDTIEQMLELQERRGGIVTPKIVYGDDPTTIWCAGGRFTPIIKKPVQVGLNQKDCSAFDQEKKYDFANGCALLLDKETVDKIGLLDESFFLYYEDTEYSMRAVKKGIFTWYCPKALVYHKVNGSTKGNERYLSVYYITRNWLIYAKMHLGWRFLLFVCYFFLNRLAWSGIWLLQGKSIMLRAIKRGVEDYSLWCRTSEKYTDRISEEAMKYIEKK